MSIDAYHKFLHSGIQVHANLDAHMQLMSASQLNEQDVAVIISHSGSTKDMIDILHVLRDKNVTIIAITNFAKSTLTKHADILLYTVSQQTEFGPEALSSRIAELTLIDALYTNVMLAKGESAGTGFTGYAIGNCLKTFIKSNQIFKDLIVIVN
ncbi:MurR/RpiR family transcriptional regulator [Virgibacillus sp.]|uniref:MurR/RpiR family transcriptional regulator n=1 Tax=Virgibacillus sp. TaxID=1872700 RepID=UPI00345BA6A1